MDISTGPTAEYKVTGQGVNKQESGRCRVSIGRTGFPPSGIRREPSGLRGKRRKMLFAGKVLPEASPDKLRPQAFSGR
jgi:hypothetical protein